MGRFQPGHKKIGGRVKGQPNGLTKSVKAALEEAFDLAGGIPALVDFAKSNPPAFYALWGKLLPVTAEVSGSISLPLTTQVNVLFHAVAAAERPAIRGDGPAHPDDAAGRPEPAPGPSESVGV